VTPYEGWSGETWFLHADHASSHRSIAVIEPASQQESPSKKSKKKGSKLKTVPFGFSRETSKTKPKRR
jgi:hypothetical protein